MSDHTTIAGAWLIRVGLESTLRLENMNDTLTIRKGPAGWQNDCTSLAYKEGFAFLPVEGNQHLRHGLGFGIVEIGQALQDVVRVYPAVWSEGAIYNIGNVQKVLWICVLHRKETLMNTFILLAC